jgi:proline dehydrogenase
LTLLGRLVIAVAGQSWIRRLVTEHRWGRAVAIRFVAGETLDDAVRVSRELNGRGLSVSFDHLGEHTTDLRLAARARDDYLSCIERIASEGLDAGISVKLTQLGLGLDDSLAEQSLRTLAARAAAAGIGLTIDMEESAFTERTRDLYCRVQQGSGNLGVALQACLRRTPEDMRRLLPTGGLIRLCKGAYREPRSLAWQRGREVDRAFDFLLGVLMAAETVTPAIATHDRRRIEEARRLGRARKGPFEFQMLFGVRPPLQRALVAAGCRVRIYLPYGDSWYPYLSRRIAERPANIWFSMRALLGRKS